MENSNITADRAMMLESVVAQFISSSRLFMMKQDFLVLRLAVSDSEVEVGASARKALLLGGGSGDRHDRWESSGMIRINWVLLIQSPTNLLL